MPIRPVPRFAMSFHPPANPPRKHHFIPVFYLKRWARPDGKIVEHSKFGNKLQMNHKGPKATGYQNNLYTFEGLPSPQADHLELNFLRDMDALAAIVLDRLLKGDLNIYEPKYRNAWSRFLVSLLLRHPDAIAEFKSAIPRILTASAGDLEANYKSFRKPSDPLTFLEYSQGRGPEQPNRLQLYILQGMLDNLRGGQHINDLKWSTLRFHESHHTLLTSDWPLTTNVNGHNILVIPLSPRFLFVASPDLALSKEFSQTKPDALIKAINNAVVGEARRYVWANDEVQTSFIERRMSKTMRPTPLYPFLKSEFP
jgi:hypothetical protein